MASRLTTHLSLSEISDYPLARETLKKSKKLTTIQGKDLLNSLPISTKTSSKRNLENPHLSTEDHCSSPPLTATTSWTIVTPCSKRSKLRRQKSNLRTIRLFHSVIDKRPRFPWTMSTAWRRLNLICLKMTCPRLRRSKLLLVRKKLKIFKVLIKRECLVIAIIHFNSNLRWTQMIKRNWVLKRLLR